VAGARRPRRLPVGPDPGAREPTELASGDPRLYGTNPLMETKGLIDKAKDALT